MALYIITRRTLGSVLTPSRPLSNSSREVRMYKGVTGIKCNAFLRTRRQPVIRFRKKNFGHLSQTHRLETLWVHPTPFPPKTYQITDQNRLNCDYNGPISRYAGFPGVLKKPVDNMGGYWRWYAQAKEPGSPAPSKGGPVTTSGGGVGKLDAANESGFFHKVNKSRLDQIKQMLKEKAMLRGTDNHGKTDSK